MIKKLLYTAFILIIIGIIGSIATNNSRHHHVTVNEKIMLNKKNFSSIKINLDNADVEMISVDHEKEAKVEVVGKGDKNTVKDFAVKVENETLSIELERKMKNQKWFNFDFNIDIQTQGLKLKVYVPRKMYKDIKVESFASDIHFQDINAKSIELSTDNGDIKGKNIDSKKLSTSTFSGDINLESIKGQVVTDTDNGDIRIKDANVTSLRAETFSGNIEVKKLIGPITAKTDNGDIFISTPELVHDIKADAFSGDINIETEKEPVNAKFKVSTFSGDVHLFNKYNNNAIIGNGDVLIQLETDNGDISVVERP